MVTGPGSILAVMAHPDDAELWAGGTLALHARHQPAVIAVEERGAERSAEPPPNRDSSEVWSRSRPS